MAHPGLAFHGAAPGGDLERPVGEELHGVVVRQQLREVLRLNFESFSCWLSLLLRSFVVVEGHHAQSYAQRGRS